MAKVIVINDVDPRELGMVLDKALGHSQPMGTMVKIAEGTVTELGLGDFLRSLGVNIAGPVPKNNKGGKQ